MTDLISFNFCEIQNVTFGLPELMPMQNTVSSLESVQDRALKLSVLQEQMTGMGFSGSIRNLKVWLDNFQKVLKGEEYYTIRYLLHSIFRISQQVFPEQIPRITVVVLHHFNTKVMSSLFYQKPKRIRNHNIICESTLEIPIFFYRDLPALLIQYPIQKYMFNIF